MKTEYIECDCHTELLKLDFEDDEEYGKYLYMGFYKYGHLNQTSWKQRFYHIWHILRTGIPWNDEVILDKEERLKLTNFLNSLNFLEDKE